jgi:hypothetical protein
MPAFICDENARLRFRLPLMERCAPCSSGDVSNNRLPLKTASQHLPKALNEAEALPAGPERDEMLGKAKKALAAK